MNRIFAISLNTFKEAIRDKLLYLIVLFAVILIGLSKILGWISMGEDIKIILDMGLSVVSIFGLLIAIFIGGGIVYKEIDKRTIYTILCRPLPRYQFVVGKYIGLILTISCTILIMSTVLIGYVYMMGGGLKLNLFVAAGMIFLEMAVITAMAIFLSAVSTPILSAVFTFCFYVIGHLNGGIKEMADTIIESPLGKQILYGVYYLLPNLENFNVKLQIVHDLPVQVSYLLFSLGYCVLYTTIILGISFLIFNERDF